MLQKQFVITKKISKQGNKSIICIPTWLSNELYLAFGGIARGIKSKVLV